MSPELTLERRDQTNKTAVAGMVMITPPISEDYWAYRVRLTDKQSIVGFPKFGTVGVGFAVEDDWNTNLPYTCGTEEIYEHIKHNAGDDPAITRDACIAAIQLVQDAATEDRA